ncbi:putative ABC transporter ATP-binding protein YtlC [Thalassobacillus devorans]|uniref:ABC transporter ATP-binding protein YtlC n=1 Tax=Thalassobacillus devorans TaxID=279813 RepID=A0ABQ1NMV7_9BACI|nr:ABC transporter ATP-binding protein [Thalassobacillus devorans]NIK29109.1 NitT/TauT family transport system ATP-binding protein [Thalassobacillus devorans]GGC81101.1 putative ABC transporter ATP-binding protein YtlC [Thalassobacillus devorans]
MPLLSVNQVSHHYYSKKDYTKALENISFTLEQGEFISILGPSGCGKTTLLSIVAGLINPTRGEIILDEVSAAEPGNKAHMGYMLQQDYLFPWKTIKENIMLGPKINKTIDNSIKERADQMLEEVGLQGIGDSYPDELSGGMRQRAALARTLITEPKLLLLDEPFSALDFQTKLRLEDFVSQLLKQYNKAALLVTHDISEAIVMSDRIILLKPRPGEIKQVFRMPPELRKISPFQARQHPSFQAIFDEVWKEMSALEKY